MEIIVFLSIVIAVVAVLTSIVLVRRVKKQIAEMTDVLVDVKNGNGNRRILSATNELTAPLAYEINEIVVAYESRLSTVRQTEETNRQLMTSLSHDVRTPLTKLLCRPQCSPRKELFQTEAKTFLPKTRKTLKPLWLQGFYLARKRGFEFDSRCKML